MLRNKFDISFGLDRKTNEGCFFIPVNHLHDNEPFIKMIIDKEYWPAVKESENHLQDLYIDTTRLQHSSILFNHCSASACLPDPDAKDPETEQKHCLKKFDNFLNLQFKSLKENILKQYKQDLINFPGNVLFQSLAIQGHTLRGKTFSAEIQSFLDSFRVISIIQNIKYVPKGKDPFNFDDILPLPGTLRSRLEFIEETEKRGFNISIETESPVILALILGEVTNKKYIQFLEDFLKIKKNAYVFINDIRGRLLKFKKNLNEMKNTISEKESFKIKLQEIKIEECFYQASLVHAELDMILATQDRASMSSAKLNDDIARLNRCERLLKQLSKKSKNSESDVQCLIQQRKAWFSREDFSSIIFETGGTLDNLRKYPDITCMPW